MIQVKILNSPIDSESKMRYFTTVFYFYAQSVSGQYSVSDSEIILLPDASSLELLKLSGIVRCYGDVLGNNSTIGTAIWLITPSVGGSMGTAMKPRIITPGTGKFTYNNNGIAYSCGQTVPVMDLSSPDGKGLNIIQGSGLTVSFQLKNTNAYTATVVNTQSWLYALFGCQKS